MLTIDELREQGLNDEVLSQVEGETILYARGSGESTSVLTSRGHLVRVFNGDQLELTVVTPLVQLRTHDSTIVLRSSHGTEILLFEPDPALRNSLFRRVVDALIGS